MKGATSAADDLARFLAELTAELTVRELAQRYGGGKTMWSEYRSGARVVPLGRLNAVVRDRVRDGRGRQAMLQRARRLHEAALVAEAEAGPRPRLDEALRRAEADLAAAEGLVRSLLALLATLLGEKAGPRAEPPEREPNPNPKPQPEPEPEPESEATVGGLMDRAFRELGTVRSLHRAARHVLERAQEQNRAALSAGSGPSPTAGGDLSLALARTADALAHSAYEVQGLWRESKDVPGGGRAPLEGVVLERTDRPSAARVHMRTAPPTRPDDALPMVPVPAGVAPAAPHRGLPRSSLAAVAAAIVLAVLALAASAATAVVVATGQQPVWTQAPLGPLQQYARASGADVRSPAPTPTSTPTPTAPSPSPASPTPTDRSPSPAPSPNPDSRAPGAGPAPIPGSDHVSPQPTPSKEPGPKEPPGGLFRLANDGSRLCLAVPLRSNTAADGIVQADCGGIAEQEWYLTRETTDPSGTVYSVRNRFSGMCLSVDAARTTNDAAVTHYVCGDREGLFPDQFWKVRYDGGHRAWQLVNVHSGKCAGARPGDGANAPVLQRDCRDDPWLMWAQ